MILLFIVTMFKRNPVIEMKIILLSIIYFLTATILVCKETKPTNIIDIDSLNGFSSFYQQGKASLKNKDTTAAEKYFRRSIDLYNDNPSFFELAKILIHKNTILSRQKAYELLRTVLWREPLNIEYRYEFATLAKIYSKTKAENEFKKIISIDSTHINSWNSLAKMKDDEFTEYNNSARKMGDEFLGSLQEFADEDFYSAEFYYKKALSIDRNNYEANYNLSLLYEKAGKPELGISLLEKLIQIGKADENVHLALGLLYYKTNKMKECYAQYQIALSIMNEDDREDFKFNSVKFLIEPAFEKIINEMNYYELKDFIDLYWKYFDPLFMTDYNERLLEHYSRVAYANLRFSVPKMGKIGWKTNRGEVIVRYGEPLNFVRLRPSMGEAGVNMKTEVWSYDDMTLGFTDMASSGNYLFSVPANEKDKLVPQFSGNSLFHIEYLRKARHFLYDAKFEGPKIDIPFSIAQFRSLDKRNHTDVYINYKIDVPDSIVDEKEKSFSFDEGFFFFNNNIEEQFRNVSKVVEKGLNSDHLLRSSVNTIRPDSGFASFELIREKDKGTFAKRFNLKVKKFSNMKFDVSDLLFADYVGHETRNGINISRKDIHISPSVSQKFSKANQPYLYYEVYNLEINENKLTDFEQRISIAKVNEKPESDLVNAAKKMFEFLGLEKHDVITLTSNYQTLETDPQIYLQLDLSKYESGKYLIILEIFDRIQKLSAKTESIIDWQN